ncbi:MAG: tetratricopeptide repeat protein, partial [Cyclobacteriaceae bacterium]
KKGEHLDKYGNPMEELITEIQSSKDEIRPESEKQKQQIEIINQFIRIQPSISNAKDRAPSPIGDLNPVKPGEFGDHIVSETLVEILIKQGKKDRAIEVLKKLIWKYPQKKAYFASQIEDLKK